jgi:hypothetical protein
MVLSVVGSLDIDILVLFLGQLGGEKISPPSD